MKKLTDSDIIPSGAYKGLRMIDVPAHYLLWLYENNKASGLVKEYILGNLEAIRQGK